jgi:hypothetical protein
MAETPARRCEERSDEAIQRDRVRRAGLLRFARNDDGGSRVGVAEDYEPLKLTIFSFGLFATSTGMSSVEFMP